MMITVDHSLMGYALPIEMSASSDVKSVQVSQLVKICGLTSDNGTVILPLSVWTISSLNISIRFISSGFIL